MTLRSASRIVPAFSPSDQKSTPLTFPWVNQNER